MGKLYRWLWSHIGGRMWTYIIRDSYHDAPLLWLIGLLSAGALLGNHYGMLLLLKVLCIFLVGTLAGHLFWGTKWKEGQRKEG